MGARIDPEVRAADAPRLQRVHLPQQAAGIDHHAVADQTQGVGVENARGNGAQLVHLAPLLDGVPRIVATLCADDDLCLLRENVDDLALAFVAPLDAHNNL